MKVSIVVPAFNASRYLHQTIDSVMDQTVGDWELIVVDDGSADDTADVVLSYGEIDSRIRLLRQSNVGTAEARNNGFAATSAVAEYVAFLDHDDVWERDALERLINTLSAHPDAVAVHGLSRYIDERGDPLDPGELEVRGRRRTGVVDGRLVQWPVDAPTTFAVLVSRNCICTPGQVLLRRIVLQRVGPFDPASCPCDDWDMWLRISQLGDIAFLDRVVLSWRVHGSNRTNQHEVMRLKQDYVRRKLIGPHRLSREHRRVAVLAGRLWSGNVCRTRLNWSRQMLAQGELRSAAEQLWQAFADYVGSVRGSPATTPVLRPSLRNLYRLAESTPSDINEHVDTLNRLARRCKHVTEFGMRWGVSTTAMLAARPSVLVSYDRERLPSVEVLESVARGLRRTRFVFHQADVRSVEIEETDMLFIDTWHTYDQLRHELARHAHQVRRFLVFHDTTTYGEYGEEPGQRGLWPAIEEFLREHPEWVLAGRLANNNGLTVLTRIEDQVDVTSSLGLTNELVRRSG